MSTYGEPQFLNLRDMGGLVCEDGKQIKAGKIFRCPKLYTETEEQKAVVDGMHLDAIVDLRGAPEQKEKPDYVPEGCTYISAPAYEDRGYKYNTVTTMSKVRVVLLRGEREKLLLNEKLDSYKTMPFSRAYFELFRLMDEGKTFAFHCTEGKDRTGTGAALIEYCLGRSKEDILEEYLKSNDYRPGKDRSIMKYVGCSDALIRDVGFCESCHEELFQISIDTILSRYDSIDDYLWKWFGIDEARKEKWRAFYCE